MGTSGLDGPARLGRYELLIRLASGGMGEIFLARLEGAAGFEKLLVVKRILPHLADDARFRAMLIAEARIASRMTHANICQVYELDETDGQLYIVMEYLEGIGLLALLRKASKEGRPLELGFIGGVVQQCTEALHYAHELRDHNDELLGVVHRDVTPGNIFITESGLVKLLDFGIAKVKDASASTQTGTVKGKHAYMAPEQLRGAAIDRRVDVFALGVVIYEMLALRRLFQRKTDYLTLRAIMEQPIPDVRRYRPDTPAALAEVLARALDRDPDRRPATARQLGASVLEAIGDLHRPWSQADICDFLRAHFADELGRRAETARAIRSNGEPPSLAEPPPELNDELDDEDDGVPFVEADLVEDSLARASRIENALEDALENRPTRELSGQTPSFEAVTGGEHAAPPAQATDTPPSLGVVHERSLLWPLLAIAMVGITAGALFLVWKHVKQPETIAATEPSRERPDTGPAPTPPASAGGAGQAATAADPGGGAAAASSHPATAAKPADPYTAVINAHRPQMNSCVTSHALPAGDAKVSVKVKVVVAPSGKPREVSFEPDTLDGATVGGCIKRTLSAARFPSAREERIVTFRIWI